MSRLERLLALRDLLGQVFDVAWAHDDQDVMDRTLTRMRAVSAEITRAVVAA